MAKRTDKIERRPLTTEPQAPRAVRTPAPAPTAALKAPVNLADLPTELVAEIAKTAPKLGAVTKCVYFKEGTSVQAVEHLLRTTPTASLSLILSQLLDAFVKQGLPQAASGERVVTLNNVKVVL